jgi:hypothetical protein
MTLNEFALLMKKDLNMTFYAGFVAVILLAGVAPAICRAQDFSADVLFADGRVNAESSKADASNHASSKVFVSHDKMRLELGGPAGTVLLLNATEQTTFALFPAKKEYEPLSGGLSEYFWVSDAEDACPDWRKASVQKVDCERVGHEAVDGRQTVKYRNRTASDAAISAVWIDKELKFVVKWEGAGTGVELRNIHEGKQAEEMFALPSDYDLPKPRKGTNKGFSHQ